jgi:hypothetical protein
MIRANSTPADAFGVSSWGARGGPFSPVRWICWHPFGGIGLKAARPNRTAEQVYGQPNRRVGVRVRRSQLMREKSLVPKFR